MGVFSFLYMAGGGFSIWQWCRMEGRMEADMKLMMGLIGIGVVERKKERKKGGH